VLFVAPATRLDPVLRLKERDEQRAARELARAAAETVSARERLDASATRARRDERRDGPAREWLIVEAAHGRALVELSRDATRVRESGARERAARGVCADVHRRTETVRRAVEVRRREIREERARAERRSFDEIAALLFNRVR
jgi:flagellar biosynthesis chaperone FliJ